MAEVVHHHAEIAIRTYRLLSAPSIIIIINAAMMFKGVFCCRYYISEKRASTASSQLLKILLQTYVYFTINDPPLDVHNIIGIRFSFFILLYFVLFSFTRLPWANVERYEKYILNGISQRDQREKSVRYNDIMH